MQATMEARQVVGHGNASTLERILGPRTTYARLIGALFLIGFLTYGVGFTLVNSVITAPDFLSSIPALQTTLLIGAFLMLLNTVVDVGKGVLFFPILENHGRRTALVYLSAILVQVVFLDLGVLFLLMLAPLAHIAADAGASSAAWAPGLGMLLTESNTIAYNVGQATLSFGGVFLCLLLFRTRLIPQVLAGLGVVGYILHGAGSISEIFGLSLSLYLLIPGALFEIGIAFWLIFKGFNSAVVRQGAASPVTIDRPGIREIAAPAGVAS
jgi:Domain of unknown function (DUF4386)